MQPPQHPHVRRAIHRLGSAFVLLLLLTFGPASASSSAARYVLSDTIRLPGSTRWDYLTDDPGTARLFITRGDSVDILDTASQKVIGRISGLEGVHGVALADGLGKGFLSEGKANRVDVFDLKSFRRVAAIPTGKKPDAIVYDPATQRVFAADGDEGDLTVIDARANKGLGTIALGGAPEFAVVDAKGALYVNLVDRAQIAVVDTTHLKVVAHYGLGPSCKDPTGLAIDISRERLFATCGSRQMVVLDAASGAILDQLPIGDHSDAAVFDDGTGLAFSSNGNDGTLTIVGLTDDGHYKVLETVSTKITARTMAVDRLTHKIYLAAAETDGFDAATRPDLEPRRHIRPDSFMILTFSFSQ